MPRQGKKAAANGGEPQARFDTRVYTRAKEPSSETLFAPTNLRRSRRQTASSQVADQAAEQPPNVAPETRAHVNMASSDSDQIPVVEAIGGAMDKAENVTDAIERLVKMERRFRRDVQRQKLRVEESITQSPHEGGAAKLEPGAAMAAGKARTQPRGGATAHITERPVLPTPDGDGDDTAGRNPNMLGIPEDEIEDADQDILESTEDLEAAEQGAGRPPAVNSDYLPLPWKGRLGYACLNTYLRNAKPPVFCSRTCRMASIIEHRHPLMDPSQPESSKNRPDRTKPASRVLGDRFVQGLGLANARDLVKMLRWNEKYGIRFMRLSSEMFPFASHPEHGYKLAPFASEVLAEAGKVVAELGHRVTMHPGQFTQLGSPRKEVIDAAVRDLEYHDELLSLLRLPPQQDRDAVMIIHMGGTYGDKTAALDRFRANYRARLSASVRRRLVLENDDVSWSVHDLLPVCEELDIPLVLDYHHHNIVFDAAQVREGTLDVSRPALAARIAATWRRKGIRQKMHYSEPVAGATTRRDRRRHAARVRTLPPCPDDMDLMIEAKDKEQAVLELMRTFRLPGHELSNDVVPHERPDEGRPPAAAAPRKPARKPAAGEKRKRGGGGGGGGGGGEGERDGAPQRPPDETGGDERIPRGEFAMGGPMNRVYWPLGMEEWLRPRKKERKPKPKGQDEDGFAE